MPPASTLPYGHVAEAGVKRAVDDRLLIGKSETPQWLLAAYANRHGLIAGATGTGKTVTLQTLAEGFSALGVPVFAADVKGDLAGLAQPGAAKPAILARAEQLALHWQPQANPVVFWDVYGVAGHPLRATVSDLGPLLLARLLDLSEVQAAVLALVFRYCDDQGLLLLDCKDLRSALSHVADHAKTLGSDYGLVSTASVGAIQRALLQLESDGAEHFFGEPSLAIDDLLRQDLSGRGIIHLLAADRLYGKPRLYASVLLWLLAELFEQLPEVGDLPKPKLVLFFDEAHLLFKDAPKALIEKIEHVVRLIRSKGVGVYFVTQNPLDVPDTVLGQLGNRVQHALRAFTPREQKAVRAAAQTFRSNPALDTEAVLMQLGVGEALVSTLDAHGVPSVVERSRICPPQSRIGALDVSERQSVRSRSPLAGKYEASIDRESAYEKLQSTASASDDDAEARWRREVEQAWGRPQTAGPARRPGAATPGAGTASAGTGGTRGRATTRDTVLEAAVKSATRSAASSLGRELGRQLLRGLLGSLSSRR